jgi:hypothetical protein
MDSVFRTKNEEVVSEDSLPVVKERINTHIDDKVEVPFTEYRHTNGKPYTVDYFDLGTSWNDPEGGFEYEVDILEKYFEHKIEQGEIGNSNEAIKAEIKKMEKMNNLQNEYRKPVKIGTLSAYVKFLLETEGIRVNSKKYANY